MITTERPSLANLKTQVDIIFAPYEKYLDGLLA